jgi:hypothetical protein
VAERAAEILGLTYYSPETVDLAAQDPNPPSSIDGQAADWIERRTEAMLATGSVGDHPEMRGVVRVLLEIAANGSAVLVGKGATVVLPADSTLRVRIVAPEAMRVAYIAQWERMSQDEARQYVRRREHARAVWLREMFGADQEVAENFDLVLNSEALGVEGCARVLAAAAQAKSPPLQPIE